MDVRYFLCPLPVPCCLLSLSSLASHSLFHGLTVFFFSAADVVQTVHLLLVVLKLDKKLEDLELLALFLAAVIHVCLGQRRMRRMRRRSMSKEEEEEEEEEEVTIVFLHAV